VRRIASSTQGDDDLVLLAEHVADGSLDSLDHRARAGDPLNPRDEHVDLVAQ
jgi:hypothetical protein